MKMEGDGENGSGGGRRQLLGGVKEKMSLEHYVDFFISRDSHGFTVNFLNQVIQMHGFMKIRSPKNVIADAIDTLDLVEPWRSTVKQNVTSSTATSTLILDDVIADLEYLKWQECCMTSLQILNAEKEAAKIAPAMSKFKDKSSKRKKSSTKRDDSLQKAGNKKKNRKKSGNTVKSTCGSGNGGTGNVEADVPSSSLEVPFIKIPK